MAIRFYIDADLLGLAKVLVLVRADVTYPGDSGGLGIDRKVRPPCPIQPGEKDHLWIPKVAAEDWVIITHDHNIKHKPAEKNALLEHRARIVQINAPRLDKWGQLEIVVSQWRRIEDRLALLGPWYVKASRTCRGARGTSRLALTEIRGPN